jgi:hypothetical protein
MTGEPSPMLPLPPVASVPSQTRRPSRREDSVVASCGGCDERWGEPDAAHCPVCHHTWPGVAPFDQHLREGCRIS